MSRWRPIAEAKKDGRPYLLWFPKSTLPEQIAEDCDAGIAIDGWYWVGVPGDDEGWATAFGHVGEPTYFQPLLVPTPAEPVDPMQGLEALVAACEREYLTSDPDETDISIPPCGITMGMIRVARKELNKLKEQHSEK